MDEDKSFGVGDQAAGVTILEQNAISVGANLSPATEFIQGGSPTAPGTRRVSDAFFATVCGERSIRCVAIMGGLAQGEKTTVRVEA